MFPQDTRVQLDLPHRVRFTRDPFAPGNATLASVFTNAEPGRALIVVDRGLLDARPNLQAEIAAYAAAHATRVPKIVAFRTLPGGETVKNDLSLLEELLGVFNHHRLDRHAYIIAIGGGALLDTVGFAAAVCHRGLRLVRMPTTTLSQADSGIGVKNGVNMFGQKNFIGTFAVPHAVVNDLALLEALSDRDWRCGLSEAVKVALLKDAAFFAQIERDAERLARRDPAAGDPVWQRSAALHLGHITRPPDEGGDPFELTTSRPLDAGHWAAHQLERMSDFTIRHGEAVALGLALDADYAHASGLLPAPDHARIVGLLERLGFDLHHPLLADPRLIEGIEAFREHLGGRLTLTLFRGVGEPIEVHALDTDQMERAARSRVMAAAASGFATSPVVHRFPKNSKSANDK